MKKEFIRDGGKVRRCVSNIAKMNVFELIYYRRDMLWRSIVESVGTFVERMYYGIVFVDKFCDTYCISYHTANRCVVADKASKERNASGRTTVMQTLKYDND
jgi:hypothetical protein